jgi:hypothetical protein
MVTVNEKMSVMGAAAAGSFVDCMDNNNCIGEVERGAGCWMRSSEREERGLFPPHPCPVNINITRLGLNRTVVHLSFPATAAAAAASLISTTTMEKTSLNGCRVPSHNLCFCASSRRATAFPLSSCTPENPPNDFCFPTTRVPGSVILQGDNVCARTTSRRAAALPRSPLASPLPLPFAFRHCSWQAAKPTDENR